MNGRLLVFNCHEAWVHQLHLLEKPLDIIIDLPGRHTRGWDEGMRPVPRGARLVNLSGVLAARETYDCIIAHNLTDLLDVKTLPGPRLLVLHIALEGIFHEQQATTSPAEFRRTFGQFIFQTRTHVVAVSPLKGRSWGFANDIVSHCVDPSDYPPWRGTLAAGLRISNFVTRRANTLLWDFHKCAFNGLPVTLVGHNPELPGIKPSRSWTDLKETLSLHRFFIHTADPKFEDGYNLATLEAMAAGLPVLGNRHPTSPVVHGVNGFLSNDPAELRQLGERLLADRELAASMGRAAQETVRKRFSPRAFREEFSHSVSVAQEVCRGALRVAQ